jgi:putative phosphoesterase
LKKILVLSDTHGYIDDRILDFAKNSDEVWHVGDFGSIEVLEKLEKTSFFRGVYGNIDNYSIRKSLSEYEIFEVEKLKVLLIHIAGNSKNLSSKVENLISYHKPNILVCGHSHILKVEYLKSKNILYLNPGAAGKYGFHKIRTMIKFEVINQAIEKMNIIELGRRSKI